MDRNWNLGKLLVDIERCFYHIKQIKIEHIWHFGIVQTTRFFFTKKYLRKVTIATISPWQQCCLYSKKYTQFWGFMRAFQLALCQFLYFNHFHIFLSFKKHTQFHIETKKSYCCAAPFLANCWCSRIWEIHVFFTWSSLTAETCICLPRHSSYHSFGFAKWRHKVNVCLIYQVHKWHS